MRAAYYEKNGSAKEVQQVGEIDTPEPGAGEVLVKTIAFAITAGTRAGLQGSASYAGAPQTGIVMNGTGVGEVVQSDDESLTVGAKVAAPTGWQARTTGPMRRTCADSAGPFPTGSAASTASCFSRRFW